MKITKKHLLEFLQGIDTFRDFEEKLSKVDNEKTKGTLFELFCQAYLVKIHPEEFKYVELFENVKSTILRKLNLKKKQDYGIDIVALTQNNKIWTIQSKFRTSNILSWRELSTFFGSSEKADFRLVMGNLNQILHPLTTPNFSSVLRTDFKKLNGTEFKKIKNYLGERITIEPIEPWPTQIKALKKTIAHFKTNNKGQLIHPCGSGKTETALWLKEKLKPKNTIVLVPSLALLKQTLERWSKYKKEKFTFICVCSDKTVTKELDEPEIDITELGVQITTKPEEISEFIKRSEKNKIIFSTYHSTEAILQALQKHKEFSFDLGIFDEAHNTASKENGLYSKSLNLPIKKKLFMTATPTIYLPHLKKMAKEEDIILCSMDDKTIYGEIIDELKFGDAIKKGLLSDYKIKIIVVSDEEVKELIDRRYWVEVLEKEMTADELAKIWALIKASKYINHTISFHSKIKDAKNFEKNLQHTLTLLRTKQENVPEIKSYHVSSEYATWERSNILEEFITEKKSLVTNARCLTEGVNIPSVDGVYFVDPKKSTKDIVQATGRAIRKSKGKKYGYIIIPVFSGNQDNTEELLSSSAFNQVWKVLAAMKNQDERLQNIIEKMQILEGKKKFGSIKSREKKELQKLEKGLRDKIDTILPIKFDSEKFFKKINIKTLDVIGKSWDKSLGEYQAYKQKHGREPTQHEGSLGIWCNNNRRAYKEKKLSEEKIKKLKDVGFKLNGLLDLQWGEKYKQYVEFKKKYNREPLQERKRKGIEGELRHWCDTQRLQYKNGTLSNERKRRLEQVGFRLDNYVDLQFDQNYKQYVEFKKKYNREPSAWSKEKREMRLGCWCTIQRNKHNKKKLSKERIKKLENVDFRFEDKIDLTWNKNYGMYVTFKQNWVREPKCNGEDKQERHLAHWAVRQRIAYNEKKLPKNKIIQLTKCGFIWEQYQNITKQSWNEKLKKYLLFKQIHNREPKPHSQDQKEAILGRWCTTQRTSYKKGITQRLFPERIKKLEESGFNWSPRRWGKAL